MLKIYKELAGKRASSPEWGDANGFLQSVLVEVATENYRQLMFESLALAPSNETEVQLHLDPPLRANERVISGLFATAIGRIAPRSRPEARIDRTEWQTSVEALSDDTLGGDGATTKTGRVDYLAWYGQRIFAVELKAAAMNCERSEVTKTVSERWNKVVKQARSAQTHLRRLQLVDPVRYPEPVSLALMVVIGRRAISASSGEDDGVAQSSKKEVLDEGIEAMESCFMESFKGLKTPPTFRALYTFPQEFRQLAPRKEGRAVVNKSHSIYTPFVAFLGKALVKGS
jgi:hypothetical protein